MKRIEIKNLPVGSVIVYEHCSTLKHLWNKITRKRDNTDVDFVSCTNNYAVFETNGFEHLRVNVYTPKKLFSKKESNKLYAVYKSSNSCTLQDIKCMLELVRPDMKLSGSTAEEMFENNNYTKKCYL